MEICRLFALPPCLTFVHMEHCHFQKPSGSCGKVSSSWDQRRSPRRGAGISSAPCEGFANQVISSALHHAGGSMCGSLPANRHLNCMQFVFSVLSQPQKLQSFRSGTVFVFTYSTRGAQWTLLQRNKKCSRDVDGYPASHTRLHIKCHPVVLAFLVHTLGKGINK